MVAIINPFDTLGYTQAEMTRSINKLPNLYGRTIEMGLFRPQSTPLTTIIVEERDQTINLLPSLPRGAPRTRSGRDQRKMRAFVIPHIPHEDIVLPQDIQSYWQFGNPNAAETLANKMADKLEKLRRQHNQTREYMQVNALKGVLKDGAGVTLYNWYTEFGITKKTVNFALATADTEVELKINEVLRHMEDNLRGETMTGVYALVSTTFMDKLTTHPKIREAYKYFANQGPQIMREDIRRRFVHKGMVFEEYNATFPLADGTTTEKAFADNYGIAFPMGTNETFETHFGPSNFIDTVNQPGVEVFARQVLADDASHVRVISEANPLPICRRPALLVELTTN